MDSELVPTGVGVVRMLKQLGIRRVFGVPDGHTLPLYEGFRVIEGVDHVLVNDERSAGFAADAYARVTGTVGACDAGAAGSMNFPVALAEALGAASPVLALVGVVKRDDVLRNVPHDVRVAETLAPVTKLTKQALVASHVPRFLSHAVKVATRGKPGPVALVVPEDILSAVELPPSEFEPPGVATCAVNECRFRAAQSEVDRAVELIRRARLPAIFAGGGAVQSGAFAEVKRLSQMLRAPVFTTIRGKGIALTRDVDPSPENLHFGTVGLFGEAPNNHFIRRKVDLVLAVGNRLTEDDTATFKFPSPSQAMVQVDVDPAEVGVFYKPWGVVGDPKATLQQFIEALEAGGIWEGGGDVEEVLAQRERALAVLRVRHEKYRSKDEKRWKRAEPLRPPRVLEAVAAQLGPDDYLVTDASSSSRWVGAYFPVKGLGRHLVTPRGVGPTGFGVGALLGTCMAVRDLGLNSKVVLLTGDGGLMNGGLPELETVVRLGLNCTVVVLNNAALGFVKFGQAAMYQRNFHETDRPDTDFAKLARAMGGKGTRVDSLKELDGVIAEATRGTGLHLVDVVVDGNALLPPSFY
ncbi:MAG: acetolactate synthase catalytic subunit [Promethearchaeota archaeon]